MNDTLFFTAQLAMLCIAVVGIPLLFVSFVADECSFRGAAADR